MTTRELTNHGTPFVDNDGTALGGFTMVVELVDGSGRPADTQDKFSGDHILSRPRRITVAASAGQLLQAGEFTTRLWPTDRGVDSLQYCFRWKLDGDPRRHQVTRPLPSGDGSALTWFEFVTGRQLVSDQAIIMDSTGEVFTDSTGEVLTDSGEQQ